MQAETRYARLPKARSFIALFRKQGFPVNSSWCLPPNMSAGFFGQMPCTTRWSPSCKRHCGYRRPLNPGSDACLALARNVYHPVGFARVGRILRNRANGTLGRGWKSCDIEGGSMKIYCETRDRLCATCIAGPDRGNAPGAGSISGRIQHYWNPGKSGSIVPNGPESG